MTAEIPNIPTAAFLQAVKAAQNGLSPTESVAPVVNWWNANAPGHLQCAYSLIFYVRLPVSAGWKGQWASGLPEEGIVRNMRRQTPAEPHLEGMDDLRFWLFAKPVVNSAGGYDLLDVSGVHVESNRPPDGYDAASWELWFSKMALSVFDRRFPEVFSQLRKSS